jgi:hypothetical protein
MVLLCPVSLLLAPRTGHVPRGTSGSLITSTPFAKPADMQGCLEYTGDQPRVHLLCRTEHCEHEVLAAHSMAVGGASDLPIAPSVPPNTPTPPHLPSTTPLSPPAAFPVIILSIPQLISTPPAPQAPSTPPPTKTSPAPPLALCAAHLVVLLSVAWCCVHQSCATLRCDVVTPQHQGGHTLIQGVGVVAPLKISTLERGQHLQRPQHAHTTHQATSTMLLVHSLSIVLGVDGGGG